MTIEILIYPALVFLAVTMTAKLIERQRDVLYGPYIWGRKTAYDGFREELEAYMMAIGVTRGSPGMVQRGPVSDSQLWTMLRIL